MKERLDPFRGSIDLQPHEMRGSFEECRFKARIMNRQFIDSDPSRSTGMVTFDLQDTGITFIPGDRLAVMPLNTWNEVAKMAAALGLDEIMDQPVPTEKSLEWTRFGKHIASVNRSPSAQLTVRDILRRGHISPLTKELVMAVCSSPKLSFSITADIGNFSSTLLYEPPPIPFSKSLHLRSGR
jgi:hypothetical protein